MKTLPKVGIIGGGQLGKMLVLAAKRMGFYVVVSDPTPASPAGQVADLQILGDYKDSKTIENVAKNCDILTYEIELANTETLEEIRKSGKKVYPSPKALSIIQDKFKQKEFLKSKKIIKKGLIKLSGRNLYVEKYFPFIKELAVVVVRSAGGKVDTYPVVQTIHKDNICDTVIAPAKVSNLAKQNASKLAKKVIAELNGVGVFGVEMFLGKDNNVVVNEIAPRVHNSGHFTIEACATSQFEQHIRAISNLPLGDTSMIVKAAVMKNILGEKSGSGIPEGLEKALAIKGVSFHLYGKSESRVARKMGHITVVGESQEECLKKANKARRMLII
jgi:5-(carboxyamino)imidazole ribonucleotide synthase